MRALVIDRAVVKNNLAVIRARAAAAELMVDLSSNGQGMGVVNAARILRDEGVTDFALSETRDALTLREAGFTDSKLLMLRSISDERELRALAELGVVFTVGSYAAAIALNGIAEERKMPAEARIRIDTGFGQYGFKPDETEKILNIYRRMPGIVVSGIYTGLACEKSPKLPRQQWESFNACIEKLQEQGIDTGMLMAQDDAALMHCQLGDGAAVCVGAAIIGRAGVPDRELKKAGAVEATLEEIDWAPKGSCAGHASTVKLKKTAKKAVIDVGAFNGVGAYYVFPKSFALLHKNEATVKVAGKKAAILGNVGINLTVIDVTKCSCGAGSVAVIEADPRLVRGLPIEIR